MPELQIEYKPVKDKWFDTRKIHIRNAEGGIIGVLASIEDITERKKAEAALRRAEENYRSIFENALEGIFQSSPDGRFLNVNPAMAKIYGYESPSEAISAISNIGEQLYADPEKRTEFREQLAQYGAVKKFEYRSFRKDKSIIWVQIDARVVKGDRGEILYYEGIVQDITERKRQEEDLKRQLEELKVEVDRQKCDREVAVFTESGYFQEIQKETEAVDLDEFWSNS